MHDTALTAAAAFFKIYAGKEPRILDIGSSDLNGTIRSVAPADCTYVGIDVSKGRGVDIVVTPGTKFPFDPDSFDLVVSSSCFEHDPMFWVTTLEVMRVLKPGGYFYFNAPVNGPYHRYPNDNWRFYPDSGLALKRWMAFNGVEGMLIESGTILRTTDVWDDFFAIFSKGPVPRPPQFMSETIDRCRNVRHGEMEQVLESTYEPVPNDTAQFVDLQARVAELESLLGKKPNWHLVHLRRATSRLFRKITRRIGLR